MLPKTSRIVSFCLAIGALSMATQTSARPLDVDALAGPVEIFSDDFETGDTSRWTETVGLAQTVRADLYTDLVCTNFSSTTAGIPDLTCVTVDGVAGNFIFDCDAGTSTLYLTEDCNMPIITCAENTCCNVGVLKPAALVFSCS